MGKTITVPFHGTDLLVITDDSRALVPLPPLVEGMGLDWSSQLKRLNRDPILSRSMVMMTMQSGQSAWCLPLRRVPGFLFKVDTRRIKDATIQRKVLDFQDGAYDALADACLGPETVAASDPPSQSAVLLSVPERRKLVAEARQTHGVLFARRLWRDLKLPLVAVPDNGQMALFTYEAHTMGGR